MSFSKFPCPPCFPFLKSSTNPLRSSIRNSIAEIGRRAAKSKNNHGNPIRLESKILAVIVDPTHPCAVYIAESTGTARRIVLEVGEKRLIGQLFTSSRNTSLTTFKTNEISPPYTGATAPLTSLALSPSNPKILFAGSWSRLIHSWSASTRRPLQIYAGHSDFVKALTTTRIPGTSNEVLISGGADARIIVWDIATGSKLHVLKPHARGLLDLGILPFSPSQQQPDEPLTLLSAGSVGEIRRFALSQSALTELDPSNPITVHRTSVYQLRIDEDGDLWTASADGDVVCLSPEKGWAEEMRITTGSWARAVAVEEQSGWIITAGRDEEVRVWNKGVSFHFRFPPLSPVLSPSNPLHPKKKNKKKQKPIQPPNPPTQPRPASSTTPSPATSTKSPP